MLRGLVEKDGRKKNRLVSAFTGYDHDILQSVAPPQTFTAHLHATAALTCQSVGALGETPERLKNVDGFHKNLFKNPTKTYECAVT